MAKLSGKVALITGGNSGIGLATAKLFNSEGAQVIITGRRKDDLDKAVAEIGNKAYAVQGDVSKLADLDKLFTEVKQKFGKLDILYANAGIALPLPAANVTEDHYDKQFDINVKGLFFTTQRPCPC